MVAIVCSLLPRFPKNNGALRLSRHSALYQTMGIQSKCLFSTRERGEKHIHVALLKADTWKDKQREELHKKMGDLDEVFSRFLEMGCGPVGATFTLDSFQSTEGELPDKEKLSSYDGLIISGGKHSVYDPEQAEWINSSMRMIRDADDVGLRMVGHCFGHQLIAQAFGANVQKNPDGWSVSHVEFDVTEEGSRMLGLPKQPMSILAMHQDIVTDVPKGFCLTLSGPSDIKQGFAKYPNIITIQGHPEFNRVIVDEIMEMRKGVAIPEKLVEKGKLVSGHQTDAEKFAVMTVKFFLRDFNLKDGSK